MKILIVNSLYPPVPGCSGAEKAASSLAEALANLGHELVVISLHPERTEKIEFRNGVKVYRLPLENLYWPYSKIKRPTWQRLAWHFKERWNHSAARTVGRILDAEKPEVVNTHNLEGMSAAIWREVKRRKIRLVHTLHDYYVTCTKRTIFRGGHVCEQQCAECSFFAKPRIRQSQSVDAVISVSQKTLELHRKFGAFKGVPGHVVFNIAPALPPLPERPNSSTEELVFGFIGIVDEKKGIETLLDAASRLRQPNWRLIIAGTGEEQYVRYLQEKYRDSRIEWLGFTPTAHFFAAVDVVVIPSLWPEPLPYVCVESLQAGKSIICSDSGGIPEMCHMAVQVRVVPPGLVSELADAMDQAIQNPEPWKRRGIVPHQKLDVFKEQNVSERYLDIYFPASPEVHHDVKL